MSNWLTVKKVSKIFFQQALFRKKKIGFELKNITFSISEERIAIIGKSGSGKTTLINIISNMGDREQDGGSINFTLQDDKHLKNNPVSVIFQDYKTAINPRFTVEEALLESIDGKVGQNEKKERITNMIKKVGLSPAMLEKQVSLLSGGQIQRVCIARSLLTKAQVLIFDEAFSSLDIQSTFFIIQLLLELQNEFSLKYILVTHDLYLATYFCQRLLFLREGQLEEDICTMVMNNSKSKYVHELINAQL